MSKTLKRILLGLAIIIALCGQASFAEWSEGPCPPPPGSYCTISHGAFLTFGPNGKHIAIVSGDEIRIFDLTDGSLLRTFRTEKPSLSFGIPSFSPDGELIAAPMSGDLIGIWNVTTGEELLTISTPTGPYLRVAFSPVGGSLASISGGKVELWDVSSGTELNVFQADSDPLIAIAFSPDGELLAGGGEDRTLTVWNVKSGEEVFSFTGFSKEVSSIAFSPDGSSLCAGSGDGVIRLLDLATGEERFALAGHTEAVTWVAFSPDGDVIASSSHDDTVKLYSAASGTLIYTLDLWTLLGPLSPDNVADPKGMARVFAVGFSPDGDLIGTAYCGVKVCQIDLWNMSDILGE